jgi:hypothetical protein
MPMGIKNSFLITSDQINHQFSMADFGRLEAGGRPLSKNPGWITERFASDYPDVPYL